jgi:hypothetical protein
MSPFELAIWFAGFFTELAVLVLLVYRRVWRKLPFFCAFCAWDFFSNITWLAISRWDPAFAFHAYFILVAIDSAFQFVVLVELLWSVLRPLWPSLSRSSMSLIGVLALVAGAAIWPFASLPGLAHATTREGLFFVQLQQTVSILRILFFLLLAGGSQLLSIGWRDRELQVATGFGLYSIANLTIAVIQTHQTSASQYTLWGRVGAASYICCMIYWAFSFAQKEAERREFTPKMQSFLLAVAGAARSARVGLEDTHGPKSRKPDGL